MWGGEGVSASSDDILCNYELQFTLTFVRFALEHGEGMKVL